MGTIAVVLARSRADGHAIARRMLEASGAPAGAPEVRSSGAATFAVANHPDLVESWVAADGGTLAVFAGALDNRAALDGELGVDGAGAGSADPARTVLAAFGAWGAHAPARLRGVFSGAVFDGTTLWCFRDQLGFRPFFFRDDAGAFLAASEAKQVVAGAGLTRRPDVEAAESVFFVRLDERRTTLEGVERFPKASLAVVEPASSVRLRRYWNPAPLVESTSLTVDEACERLAVVLDDAVSRAVTGNDAVSLSGGLDSPTVAAFAAPRHLALSGRPLQALSAVYPRYPSVDERPRIEAVARHLDLTLHTYQQASGPLDDLALWVDALDGPWDTLPVPEVAESYWQARRVGASTVLTGELAEYVWTVRDHLIGHLVSRGRVRPAAEWVRARRRRGRGWRSIAREAAPSLTPALLARLYVRARREHFRERDLRLLPPWVDPSQFDALGAPRELATPARNRWRAAQLAPFGSFAWTGFEADALCAARLGVQVRRPLADVDLWEFFLSLPAETKFPDLTPKSLVRRTMDGRLPDEIVHRGRKTFFDEHVLASADFEGLRRWLVRPEHRVRGVDYALLERRLERRELGLFELVWAYNLARVHAFLELFA